MRDSKQIEMSIEKPLDEVFAALCRAGAVVGKIKEESKLAGYIVIRSKPKLFSLENACTVRISVKKVTDQQTDMTFTSDAVDGVIGLGSTGKVIDRIINTLEKEIS